MSIDVAALWKGYKRAPAHVQEAIFVALEASTGDPAPSKESIDAIARDLELLLTKEREVAATSRPIGSV